MSKKIIYHGSVNIIGKPVFGKGKPYNDYGLGFYCTESHDMAMEWAVSEDKDGYANQYEMECEGLSILDLGSDEFTMLNWLEILIQNRSFSCSTPLAREAKRYLTKQFHVETDPYDIIIGYRADDSYFSFAQDFLNGTISYRQLCQAMRLGKLGQQIVLKSLCAFERIVPMGYEVASREEWYEKKQLRDRKARREYFDMDKNGWVKGDIYMPQILDEEMRSDDARLR